jgi:hypothetical protein
VHVDDGSPSGEYAREVIADGPLVYLRLGEKTGPTARDEAGRFNGTYPASGVTYGSPGALEGDPNTAVTFEGTTILSMPAALDFPGKAPFTVEVWMNQAQYKGYGFVLDHADYSRGADARQGWSLLSNATNVEFDRWDGAPPAVVAAGPLPLGVYHHVVATYDGARSRLYVDGELRDTRDDFVSLAATGVSWAVGGQSCCSPNLFVGTLDEIAVYPTALPPERVAAHYKLAGR